jgi:hypothetical protein
MIIIRSAIILNFPGQLLCEWDIYATKINLTGVPAEGKRADLHCQCFYEKEEF